MKQYKTILCVLFLSGCTTVDLSKVAPGYTEAFKSMKNVFFGHHNNLITSELIEKIPYASLAMNIGKGPKGLMILETRRDKKSTWVSADNVYLVETHGKIIETQGLNNNLDEILLTVDFSNLKEIDTDQTYTYFVTFSDPKLSNLKLEARFFKKEKQSVKLINQELSLMLIEENIFSPDLGWRFTNQYWIDNNSFVWKSSQTISPKVPRINIEVTKKPSN